MLDFGLYEKYGELLNLPYMRSLDHLGDKLQLQVEVANLIQEFDRKSDDDSVTRMKVEELIFESSYKFLITMYLTGSKCLFRDNLKYLFIFPPVPMALKS